MSDNPEGLYLSRIIHGNLDLFLKLWAENVGTTDDCDVHYWLTKAKEAVWEYQEKNN